MFPKQLITTEMVKMYGNEAEVTNSRFDRNLGNVYLPSIKIQFCHNVSFDIQNISFSHHIFRDAEVI